MQDVQCFIKNRRVYIQGPYPKKEIDALLSTYVAGYQYSKYFQRRDRFGNRMWDGKLHLLKRDSFPLGVLPKVNTYLEENGYKLNITGSDTYDRLPEEIMENWEKGFEVPETIGRFKLRDYQLNLIKAFLKPDQYLPYYGILKASVGAGKTLVSSAIAKILDCKTLFLVKGKSLKTQTFNVYSSILGKEDVGIIDAKKMDFSKKFTIASVDTIFSRLKNLDEETEQLKEYLDSVVFVIADEVHTATAKSFADVLELIPAPIRLGLSGTPFKKETERDLLLEGFCGPILYDVTTEALQKDGHLAQAKLVALTVEQPQMRDLDWNEARDSLIVNNIKRTRAVARMIHKQYLEDKLILVLAGNSVPLAQSAYNEVKKLVPAHHVALATGQTEEDIVNDSLDKLRNKDIKVLISTVIFDQGIDLPEVNTLCILFGGKSFVKAIQRIGRGLRKKSDGGMLTVIDIFDLNNKYLKEHSRKRLSYYENENIFSEAVTLDLYEEYGDEGTTGEQNLVA